MTSAVDNIDQSGRVKFHGIALTLTSHSTHDNPGVAPPPLISDLPEDAPIMLPDDFGNVSYIDELAGDIRLTPVESDSCKPIWEREGVDEAPWLKHLSAVVENGSELHDTPVA